MEKVTHLWASEYYEEVATIKSKVLYKVIRYLGVSDTRLGTRLRTQKSIARTNVAI